MDEWDANMIKKEQHLSKRLPPVRLYYEDIVVLVDILKEAGGEIAIETPEYTIGDVAELKDLGPDLIYELQLSSRNPYVSLDFLRNDIWLYANDDTPIQKGTFDKLREFLSKRRRKRMFLFHSSWLWGGVGGILIGLLFSEILERNALHIAITALAVVGSFIVSIVGEYDSLRRYSRLYLTSRTASRSFWTRNQDSILVALIVTVVGIIITVSIERLF